MYIIYVMKKINELINLSQWQWQKIIVLVCIKYTIDSNRVLKFLFKYVVKKYHVLHFHKTLFLKSN
jgi:hypothetical protein